MSTKVAFGWKEPDFMYAPPFATIALDGAVFTLNYSLKKADELGIEWKHNAPYHPMARAPVESSIDT